MVPGAQQVVEKNPAQIFEQPFIDKYSGYDVLKENLLNSIQNSNSAMQQNAFLLPWMPDMQTYHSTGVLGYKSICTNWHSPQTTPNDCYMDTLEISKKVESQDYTSTQKSAVKCYVCDDHVIKSKFSQHLFFGSLKCNDCQIKVIDCKSFRSNLFMNSKCTHKNISWLENPIEFLKSQQTASPIADNRKVYRYIKHLKSLEHLLPWKPVIQESRRIRKSDSYLKTQCQNSDPKVQRCQGKHEDNNKSHCDEVLLIEPFDLDQMEDSIQVISLVDHEMFDSKEGIKIESKVNENYHYVKYEQKIKKEENYSFLQNKKLEKIAGNMDLKNENQFSQETQSNYPKEIVNIDNILKLHSRAQLIQTAVDKVLLKDNLFKKIRPELEITVKQKKWIRGKYDKLMKISKSIVIKRKKKTRRKNKKNKKHNKVNKNIMIKGIEVNKKMNTPTREPEIEYLDLPEDGNYLVVRNPVEECPMCYTTLSIYNSNFNVKLLIYTFWCKCGLKIFYVPKTPDNIDHPVKIVENKW